MASTDPPFSSQVQHADQQHGHDGFRLQPHGQDPCQLPLPDLAVRAPDQAHHHEAQPQISGYLIHQINNFPGQELTSVLSAHRINLNDTPPWIICSDDLRYTEQGVVKIKNIPFTIDAQEIAQFIRKVAPYQMVKKCSESYPIHIIMEKSTGKTMDAFVEFPTHEAAQSCVQRYDDICLPGRGMRIGTRSAELEISNQAELMQAVFPRARLVRFHPSNGAPTILDAALDPSWSTGFRGFFTLEEIHGVSRFSELPSRSPFVLKCHQRVYECMISTLYKFPWPATGTYTIAARNILFDCVYKQLLILSKKVGCPTGPAADWTSKVRYNFTGKSYFTGNALTCDPQEMRIDNREVGLSQSLLSDLFLAAVAVPTFSLLQKLHLCQAAGPYGRRFRLHNLATTWPFQTLVPSPGVPDHVVKFWLEVFDSGFDVMASQNRSTSFEDFIIFSRNKAGFPIAEWTLRGSNLPFVDAIRVEKAAMMCYIIEGRAAWAACNNINVVQWEHRSINDLIRSIHLENDPLKKTSTTTTNRSQSTRTPSPHTVSKNAKSTQGSNTTFSPQEAVEGVVSNGILSGPPAEKTIDHNVHQAFPSMAMPRRQPINPPLQINTNFHNPFSSLPATRHMSTDTQASPLGTLSASGLPRYTLQYESLRTRSLFTPAQSSLSRNQSVAHIATHTDTRPTSNLTRARTSLRPDFNDPPRHNTFSTTFGAIADDRSSAAAGRSQSDTSVWNPQASSVQHSFQEDQLRKIWSNTEPGNSRRGGPDAEGT